MRPRDDLNLPLSPEAWDLIENCLERAESPATSGASFLDPLFAELIDAGLVHAPEDRIQTQYGLTKVYFYTPEAIRIRKEFYGKDTVALKIGAFRTPGSGTVSGRA